MASVSSEVSAIADPRLASILLEHLHTLWGVVGFVFFWGGGGGNRLSRQLRVEPKIKYFYAFSVDTK